MSAGRTFWTITSARIGPLVKLELVQMSYAHDTVRIEDIPMVDPQDRLSVAAGARRVTSVSRGEIAFSEVLHEVRRHGAS
jgi:hypothetical protein